MREVYCAKESRVKTPCIYSRNAILTLTMELSIEIGVVMLIAVMQSYDMMPEISRTRGTPTMPDTTITTTDQSLNALLRTEADFPGYSLDLCSGYVSTDGVLLLKRMLKKSPRVRAVVGLNLTNLVSTFQMLRGFYMETHIPQRV